MSVQVLNRGSLEHNHVPEVIGSRKAAFFAANLKRRNTGNEPLVDPGARYNFDQWNAMVAVPAVNSEIHRGAQPNLRSTIARAEGAAHYLEVSESSNDFCHRYGQSEIKTDARDKSHRSSLLLALRSESSNRAFRYA